MQPRRAPAPRGGIREGGFRVPVARVSNPVLRCTSGFAAARGRSRWRRHTASWSRHACDAAASRSGAARGNPRRRISCSC